jgi:ribose 5-phosphate isomerase B
MKKLITEADVVRLYREGNKVVSAGENEIITPLALDKIKSLGITLLNKEEATEIRTSGGEVTKNTRFKKVAIGSDHTGFKIKNLLSKILSDKGYEITDVGTFDESSCDYPDFAFAVASKVREGSVDFGIIIDATGIPSAITANKLKGIRAATCYNEFSAKSAREHNNANVLVVGARSLGEETIKSILEIWLNTGFGGGRHQKRLDKIREIERSSK